ncbi:MAG: 6-carboxytetrahydropterin synthase QueD [Gammaproteobacteria bacterium]|nr:6-carboxytetrahydropterin synthase QueD [Gammaproteobacteria bacterium]NIN61832.1 6-carboxytetrahydropterin synthase QueD [Gammaproteobacteria bacterium]NIO63575.1 6-carboxytetrahydropterin synthase QueD [Gammaproteobacteria bacterium]NIP49376.1 6-carboxytetrahydropterin synthase QueD [Gammaproteobacteria bacterium]NIQ10600.1 6-carboxytetrahydropterin synthase QueD [Gammaproteobacteria bacterium]
MEIYKAFIIEAAHRLPNLPKSHKCNRLHGHSFRIEIWVHGDLDESLGWIMDFADISRVADPVIKQLDHYYLNDIPGLENPTSENLAVWIWQKLEQQLPGLKSVSIAETCNSGCVYRGPGSA